MNDVPPRQDRPDDVDESYRRASALDPSLPSEETRRAVLAHAARTAAERGAEQSAAQGAEQNASFQSFGRGVALRSSPRRVWRRPAVFGTLAAAVFAGLTIVPRIDSVRAPQTQTETETETPVVVSIESERESAAPAPAMAAASEPERAASEPERAVASPRVPKDSAAGAAPAASQARAAPAAPAASLDAVAPAAASAAPAAEAPGAQSAPLAPRNQAEFRREAGTLNEVVVTEPHRQDEPAAKSAAKLSEDKRTVAADSASEVQSANAPVARLRSAAQTGNLTAVQSLLDQNAVVDSPDREGRTALMLAVLNGHAEVVNALLARGADPNTADSRGVTPLQAATAAHAAAIVAALKSKGAQ